jgi:four helix bundle protein
MLLRESVLSLNTHTHTLAELIMFDFEKLSVYSKAKDYNKRVNFFMQSTKVDKTTRDQLRRASFSVMINIAEGSGRFTNADKRNFYIIARGSAFECVAIFDYLKDIDMINEVQFIAFYENLDELSSMLYAMIKNLSK